MASATAHGIGSVVRSSGALAGVILGNIAVIGLLVCLPLVLLVAGALVFGPALMALV